MSNALARQMTNEILNYGFEDPGPERTLQMIEHRIRLCFAWEAVEVSGIEICAGVRQAGVCQVILQR